MTEKLLAYAGCLMVFGAPIELMIFEILTESACKIVSTSYANVAYMIIAQMVIGFAACIASFYFPLPVKNKRSFK